MLNTERPAEFLHAKLKQQVIISCISFFKFTVINSPYSYCTSGYFITSLKTGIFRIYLENR